MKKSLMTAALFFSLLSSFVYAEEECVQEVASTCGYFEVGFGPFPAPIPVFGVGLRNQINHHGFDVSANVSTIVALTEVKGSLLYHFYPRPSYCSQFYYGLGLGVGSLFYSSKDIGKCEAMLSTEFVIGKTYVSDTGDRRFFQLQVSWPTLGLHKFGDRGFSDRHMIYYPLAIFSYGLMF